MSGAQEPVGTLEVALAHAKALLDSDPALAAEQASEILKVVPVTSTLDSPANTVKGRPDCRATSKRASPWRITSRDPWLN